MTTTLMDYLPIEHRDTEPLAAVHISEQDTMRVPAVDAQAVRDMALRCWLYTLCECFGGGCDGSLNAFQHDAQQCGLEVTLDDFRALRGQSVGRGMLSVLICEDGEFAYMFATWEVQA